MWKFFPISNRLLAGIPVLVAYYSTIRLLPAFLRRTQNKKKDYVVMVVFCTLTAPHGLAEKILAEGPEAFPELTGKFSIHICNTANGVEL